MNYFKNVEQGSFHTDEIRIESEDVKRQELRNAQVVRKLIRCDAAHHFVIAVIQLYLLVFLTLGIFICACCVIICAKQNARPLYEQLESEKAKKDAEYDAVTKAMFAPPQVRPSGQGRHSLRSRQFLDVIQVGVVYFWLCRP